MKIKFEKLLHEFQKLIRKRNLIIKIGIYIYLYILIYNIVVFGDRFFPTFFFNIKSNPNSARYLLSTLIQSQAAILAIVLTITLIAVQLAASSYSPRIIEIFKRNIDFLILLVVYGFSIFFTLGILKVIPEDPTVFEQQILIHNKIDTAIVLSIYTFSILFAYMWETLNLLKPSNIIDELAQDITKKKLLKSTQIDKNSKDEYDPLAAIFDFIRCSCLKHDFETTINGLKIIQDKKIEIVKNIISEDEEYRITMLFINYLESFGRLAISIEDDESAKESIRVILGLSKTVAEKGHLKSIAKINISLKAIGNAAIEKKLPKTALEAINCIYEIGKLSIKTNPELSEQSVSLLCDLAITGTEHNLKGSTYTAIKSIGSLGALGVEKKFEKIVSKTLCSVTLIGITKGLYKQKFRIQEGDDIIQSRDLEEAYKEIIESCGIENEVQAFLEDMHQIDTQINSSIGQELSLFHENVKVAFYLGSLSTKREQYTLSAEATYALKIIGETASKHRFDCRSVPIYLGLLGTQAVIINNKNLASLSINALKAIFIADSNNFDNSDSANQVVKSLSIVGAIALSKNINEIVDSAIQTLTLIVNDRKNGDRAYILLNEYLKDMQEFRKMFHMKNKAKSIKILIPH